MNEFKKVLSRTREYLDYLETHYDNVQKAWKELEKKFNGKGYCYNFIYDNHLTAVIDIMIQEHDMSKLSSEEFVQFRKMFYPVGIELRENEERRAMFRFKNAWEHHIKENPHHWENWTSKEFYHPYEATCHCVCMMCDWIAMGYVFEDNALEYYKKNRGIEIKLPEWADALVIEVLTEFYK